MKKILLIMLIIMLCASAGFAGDNTAANKADTFKVVGYYSGEWYDIPVEKLQAEKLTHVIYAFAIPTADGGFRPFKKPEELAQLIEKCHSTGTKIYIAVGGYSDKDGTALVKNFEKIAADEALMAKFIDNIIDMVGLHGFDGVELDWEYPKPATSGDYEKMIVALSAKLRPLGKGLTAALPGTGSADGEYVWDALPSVSDTALSHLDFISVMCYDLASDLNHSPIWFSNTSIAYWNQVRNIPAEKIVLGMPLYARPSWLQYSDLVKMDRENAYRDHAATTPLESTYNGLNTLREKTMLALRKAGGVMLFDVNGDTYDETSAVSTIHETIKTIGGLSDQEIRNYIWIVVDNRPIPFYKTDGLGFPFIDENNRTLVPARKILEAIGAEVNFEADEKGSVVSVSASRDGTSITINIGSEKYSVNGEALTMDTKAIIKDSRTYLPVRPLLEAFGFEITYSEAGKIVYANMQ